MKQDILLTIENFEHEQGTVNTEIEKAMMLLSSDKSQKDSKNFNEVKRELLTNSELTKVARLLSKKDHAYHGRVMCVALSGNYLFVGTSIGVIRVFDIAR
jgi:hypothetical protein